MEQLVSILRQELAETKKELEWYKLKEESGDIPE